MNYFLSIKNVGIVFIPSSYDFITSLQLILKSFITLAKYFPLLQLLVAGFQTFFFFIYIMPFTLTSIFIVILPVI